MPPIQVIRTGPSQRERLAAALTRAGGAMNQGFQQQAAATERQQARQQQQANEERRLDIAQQRVDAEQNTRNAQQRQQISAAAENAARLSLQSPEAARRLWQLRFPDGPGFDETVEPIALQLKIDKQNADLSLSVADAKAIMRSALKQWTDPDRRTDQGKSPLPSERLSRSQIQEHFPAQAFALAQRVGGDDPAAVSKALRRLYDEAVALDVFLPDQIPSDQEIRRMVNQRLGVAPLAEGLMSSGTQDTEPDTPATSPVRQNEPVHQAPNPPADAGIPTIGALNQALQPATPPVQGGQTPPPGSLLDISRQTEQFLEQGLTPDAPQGSDQSVVFDPTQAVRQQPTIIVGKEHTPWLEYLHTHFGDNEQFARIIQNAFRSGLDPALIFQKLKEKGYFAGSEFDSVAR